MFENLAGMLCRFSDLVQQTLFQNVITTYQELS